MHTALSLLALYHGLYVGTQICTSSYSCRPVKAPPISCDLLANVDPDGRFGGEVGSAQFLGKSFRLQWSETGATNLLEGSRGAFSLSLFLHAKHHLYKVIWEERHPDGGWIWRTCSYGKAAGLVKP